MLQAFMNGTNWYPCELRPFCHRHGLSRQAKAAVAASVSLLLFLIRPAAILWRISLLIVDTVKRVLRGRTLTHVPEKYLEGIPPLRADKNASASVPAVENVLGIVATLDHACPSVIFGALTHPVFSEPKPVGLFPKATAASNVSVKQIPPSSHSGVSARAAAQPSGVFGFPSNWFERGQPSELLIGEIMKRRHAGIIAESGKTRQQNFRGGN